MKSDIYFISEKTTILEAMSKLDELPVKVLFVVKENVLKASVTDGDIRRAILNGVGLSATTFEYANFNPVYVRVSDKDRCRELAAERDIAAVPIINDRDEIEDIFFRAGKRDNSARERLLVPVVIMAGGLGTRLYPYTKILPKPLIPIEGTPISERIIDSFYKMGCNTFYMIVNHKKNMIKAYYSEITKRYALQFVDEDIPLGTGGGLKKLEGEIDQTFILTNCDIIIMNDIRDIIAHHKKNNNFVTMVCSLKNFQLPYGVVNFSEGGTVEELEEKPKMSFFTNTGYYVLEPEIFNYIGENERIGMPDVIMRAKEAGMRVGIYPIGENSWLDMGQIDTMETMERRFKEIEMKE